jgi:Copine
MSGLEIMQLQDGQNELVLKF